jgi:ADP-ribose pyrophosphatase YjhB (NUDIX family)
VPIAGVDLLPVKEGPTPEIGLILRDTYHGRRGWCLVGGGIFLDETLAAAIRRHVETTLGPDVTYETASLRFVTVAEYFTRPGLGELHDPRKHSIASTYAFTLRGVPRPMGEALDFRWFAVDDLPAPGEFGFDQGKVVDTVLRKIGL